jgi:hypothetical protein
MVPNRIPKQGEMAEYLTTRAIPGLVLMTARRYLADVRTCSDILGALRKRRCSIEMDGL